MQKIYFALFISCIMLSSCATRINYVGTVSSPTNKVDVYVTEASIKKPYQVIGKGFPRYGYYKRRHEEIMQRKAVEKAKQKGADAILIQDYYVSNTSIQSLSKNDSLARGSIIQTNSLVSETASPAFNIIFIKYTGK